MEIILLLIFFVIIGILDGQSNQRKDKRKAKDRRKYKPKQYTKKHKKHILSQRDKLRTTYATTSTEPLNIPQTPFGMYMSRADKQAYMNSPEWQSKRQLVLARDNHQCVVCGSTHNLNIHHIDYSNLGDEHLSELTVLCQLCHSSLHEELGYTREGIYEPKSVQK